MTQDTFLTACGAWCVKFDIGESVCLCDRLPARYHGQCRHQVELLPDYKRGQPRSALTKRGQRTKL